MKESLANLLMDAPALRTVAGSWARCEVRERPVTRFAPSPTGELHLGHVAHAIWLWGIAAVLDARVLVRMEDHDRSRCTPGFERTIGASRGSDSSL